jgi:hypothetical protein
MPEDQPSQEPATTEPASPPSRPEPPPYKPNKELIGYIEKGLKPPKEQRDEATHSDESANNDSG